MRRWSWSPNLTGIFFCRTKSPLETHSHHPEQPEPAESQPPPHGRFSHPPVNFAPVERFGVEGDGGGVAALGTADGDFPAQFDPGHGEDGAGVGAGQREDVLLIVLQQTKDSWGGGTRARTAETGTNSSLGYGE